MKKDHSMSQFNCLCKWMSTLSFPGTKLLCRVLESPEDLQENSYYYSWPPSHLDAMSVQQAKQKARTRFQKRTADPNYTISNEQ